MTVQESLITRRYLSRKIHHDLIIKINNDKTMCIYIRLREKCVHNVLMHVKSRTAKI